VTKFLPFAIEGLQCCLGVKQRGLGRKTSCSLLGDCSHLGPPNRVWDSPFNPWNSSSVSIDHFQIRCVQLKSSLRLLSQLFLWTPHAPRC